MTGLPANNACGSARASPSRKLVCTTKSIAEIMEETFNVKSSEGLMDFSQCKTAVMFCNGMWCGQSPNNIQNLLKFGYPAHKIKWYRGGMQDWEILGLSTVKGGN